MSAPPNLGSTYCFNKQKQMYWEVEHHCIRLNGHTLGLFLQNRHGIKPHAHLCPCTDIRLRKRPVQAGFELTLF